MNLRYLAIISLCIALIGLWWHAFLADEPIPTPTQLADVSMITASPINQSPVLIETPTKNIKPQIAHKQTCTPPEVYDNDPRHYVIEQFLNEQYFSTQVDYINYLDEEELLKLAHEDNVRAMYILGLNYRWNARMANFRSELVLPPEMPKPEYKARKLDRQMMKKSRFWLRKAALNGQLSALAEIAVSYNHEVFLLNTSFQGNGVDIVKLIVTAQAYRALHDWLAPQLAENEPVERTQEEQAMFEQLLSQLKAQWTSQREALGFDSQIELNWPSEYDELKVLEATVCQPR